MKAIHENSEVSLSEQRRAGRTSHFRKRILEILNDFKAPMTDRELMDVLHEPDVNNVRPEVTRLKQAGTIVEVGKVKCRWTGKSVRRTALAQYNLF